MQPGELALIETRGYFGQQCLEAGLSAVFDMTALFNKPAAATVVKL
jgi:hypothetical protein